MCGIAGILSRDGKPVTPALLPPIIGTLRHRGPDDCGTWSDRTVALAHARLSIIDLAGGRQPMTNEDGTLWITFNGEIFNYVELRRDLEKKGHRFATTSDTEVILHLYEEKGEACVTEFNGQWAFALWDGRQRKLFLSRDRIGVRPLYYTLVGGQFAFASEVKALFGHPAVRRELDVKALDQIFTFWAPLAPRTVFKNIFELPPAHSLSVTADECRQYGYWTPDYTTLAGPVDAGPPAGAPRRRDAHPAAFGCPSWSLFERRDRLDRHHRDHQALHRQPLEDVLGHLRGRGVR
jgi:asparagine synthase (glutamine-hydrolysing)